MTAPLVAELVGMVREGTTAYRLAHMLNERGVPTQTGRGHWTAAQ